MMHENYRHKKTQKTKDRLSGKIKIFLVIFIVIGIMFRFYNLDQKLYDFDEVSTHLRASGWTHEMIESSLFQNKIIPATQLQQYQLIQPNSTIAKIINSLAIEAPQQPPLYFLLVREWIKQFGSSMTASRSLPALLSLLSLPLIYGLARELFQSSSAPLLATTFLAISPINILLAQTALPYSLLTVLIIGSSYALLKATRSTYSLFWALYATISTLGLYTDPIFGLTILAHSAYILLIQCNVKRPPQQSIFYPILPFLLALTATFSMYSPWIEVILRNLDSILAPTSWTQNSVSLLDGFKFWVLNLSVPFIDTNLDFNDPQNYFIRLPILLLIVLALTQVSIKTSSSIRLFILTLTVIPCLILILPDILFVRQYSTVTHHLMTCFLGLQLAMSYWFSTHIQQGRISLINGTKTWQVILIALLVSSLISCTLSALSETWWSKGVSYWNANITQQINAFDSPLVVTDQGDNGLNINNLISLSYRLDQDVELLPMTQTPNFYLLPINSTVFVYAPSKKLKQAISPAQGKLKKIIAPDGLLWKLD